MSERLFGGLVVNYPRAIPQKQWVLDRLLWADQIGCVWPAGPPTDRNDAEEAMLKDIDDLREARLFAPCQVPADTAETLGAEIAAGLELTNVELGDWLKSLALGPAVAPSGPKAERLPQTVDPDLFFYVNKMPPDVVKLLEDHRVARRDGNGWLKVRSAGEADKLMSIVASHAKPLEGGGTSMMLEAPRAADLGRTAAPTAGASATPAVRVELPLIGGVDPNLDVKRLIDLRLSAKGERARKKFLDEVTNYLDYVHQGEDDPRRAELAVKRIRTKILDASKELEQASPWRDPTLAVGAMAAVLSIAQVDTALSAVAAVVSGASVALGIRSRLRPSNVDGYLLKLHSKGFLSHVAA